MHWSQDPSLWKFEGSKLVLLPQLLLFTPLRATRATFSLEESSGTMVILYHSWRWTRLNTQTQLIWTAQPLLTSVDICAWARTWAADSSCWWKWTKRYCVKSCAEFGDVIGLFKEFGRLMPPIHEFESALNCICPYWARWANFWCLYMSLLIGRNRLKTTSPDIFKSSNIK